MPLPLLAALLLAAARPALAEAPLAFPAGYGPPQDPYEAAPGPGGLSAEKGAAPGPFLAPDDGGYGLEAGYQGFLVPSAEPAPAPGAGALATLVTELLAGGGGAANLAAAAPGLGALLARPLLWGLAPKLGAKLLRSAGAWLARAALAVLLGGGLTVAVCTFTPLCTLSFLGFGLARGGLAETVRAYATRDRLAALSQFVAEAVQRYDKLQQLRRRSQKPESPFLEAPQPKKQPQTDKPTDGSTEAPAAVERGKNVAEAPPEQAL